MDRFGKALLACFEAGAERAGKRRWADKNPENCLNAMHWHRLLSGRLHYVLILRNPFDVLASMKEAGMKLTYGETIAEQARHLRIYLESALDYVESGVAPCTVLCYERLVQDPEAIFGNLMTALGEPFDPISIQRVGDATHGAGLEDPKALRRNRPHVESLGRWRDDLGPDEIRQLRSAISPLFGRLARVSGMSAEAFDAVSA